MALIEYPPMPADPRNRDELRDWLKRRDEIAPGVPLSPREYLMVRRLSSRLKPMADDAPEPL